MAHIKSISFSSVSTNYGCTCDRCGQWIKNIWTVKFDDGISMNFGIDCFEKLCKSGKLTRYGEKLMRDTLKSIAFYSEQLKMWETITEQEAEEKGDNPTVAPKRLKNSDYDMLKKHLSQAFKTKVQFSCSPAGKGKITFPFDNEAELEKLICIFDKLKESE